MRACVLTHACLYLAWLPSQRRKRKPNASKRADAEAAVADAGGKVAGDESAAGEAAIPGGDLLPSGNGGERAPRRGDARKKRRVYLYEDSDVGQSDDDDDEEEAH